MVVCAIAALLLTALFIVLTFSHRVMKRDSQVNAEETLEYTIQHIDNVLLSVEQSAGNIYYDVVSHLDDPDRMLTYTRKLVESNPYIVGCAIAMRPNYYKDRDSLFMAYHYRSTGQDGQPAIVSDDMFDGEPYVRQEWYTQTMATGRPQWTEPLTEADSESEAVTTLCLPVYDRKGTVVGVLAADVSTVLLSNIVHAAKPTPKSYAVLMNRNGSFIVYPFAQMLLHQEQIVDRHKKADPSVREAEEAMAAGESGYRRIRQIDGSYAYVFFKPFVCGQAPGRAQFYLGWSAGIVLPEDDVKGDFKHMRLVVISVAFIGLFLLLVLCRVITHRQLLPLRMLAQSAQSIADGNYAVTIPDSQQPDEVGLLQKHFREMQIALSGHIGEMQRLADSLEKDGKELEQAYRLAKEAERMKTSVLHKMTNQMSTPVGAICESVDALCSRHATMSDDEMGRQAKDIEQNSREVIALLDRLLNESHR